MSDDDRLVRFTHDSFEGWPQEQTYTQGVYQAYAEIAAERQSRDVPLHEAPSQGV